MFPQETFLIGESESNMRKSLPTLPGMNDEQPARSDPHGDGSAEHAHQRIDFFSGILGRVDSTCTRTEEAVKALAKEVKALKTKREKILAGVTLIGLAIMQIIQIIRGGH